MAARQDDLDSVRAGLEARFLEEYQALFDELGMEADGRREVARQFVADIEKDAVNRTAAALTLAFERGLTGMERVIRETRRELGTSTAADREFDNADALYERGLELYKAGDHAVAVRFFEDAERVYKRRGAEFDLAACYMNLGFITRDAGDAGSAERYLTLAANIYNRLGYQENAAMAHTQLGVLASKSSDNDGAREHFIKALTRYTNAGKRDGNAAQAIIRWLSET